MSYKLIFSNLFIAFTFAVLATLAALPVTHAEPTAPGVTENSQIELLAPPVQRFKRFMQTAGHKGPSNFKSKPKRKKIKCNGQTTSDCCSGLSYCSCLYMPGSSDNTHPTSCHSTPPPSPGRG